MAVPTLTTPEKLKVPGEKPPPLAGTINAPFTSPKVQTAADVRQSQQVTQGSPLPKASGTPKSSPDSGPLLQADGQPTPSNPQATAVPNTSTTVQQDTSIPSAQATTSTAKPAAATPTVSSAPAAATATVPTTTGAPPGVPATTPPPTVGLAPTMKSEQGKNAAEDELIRAQNENAQKLYEAALKYNGGPTGALAKAARAAQVQNQNNTNRMGAAGTVESSLNSEAKTKIAEGEAVSDTDAYNVYQEEVNTANDLLDRAQQAFLHATETEKREIAEAAEKREETEAIVKGSTPAPPPTTVGAGTPVAGNPHPQPGPPPPGKEWTESGGGGWVPKGTKVVRTY